MNTRAAFTHVVVLLAMMLLAGCMPASASIFGKSPIATPTPIHTYINFMAEVKIKAAVSVELPIGAFYQTAYDGNMFYGAGRLASGEIALYAVDLVTGQTTRFGSLNDGVSSIRASGQFVVWDRSENDVLVYYQQAQKETLLASGARSPDVSGSIVVWADSRNLKNSSSIDIYGYDLISNTEFSIINRPGAQGYPRISGQWIIYLDSIGQDTADVYAYNLSSKEDFKIGTMPTQGLRVGVVDWNPVINGTRVVWVSAQDEQAHIYDLIARSDRALPIRMPHMPDLNGDILTYNASGSLMGYDLTQDVSFDLPVNLTGTQPPQKGGYASPVWIGSNSLTWEVVTKDGQPHIYLARIVRHP